MGASSRIGAGLVAAAMVCASACSSSSPDAEAAVAVTTEVVTTTTVAATTTTSTTVPVTAGDCEISEVLRVGSTGEQVQCLERHLADRGWLAAVPDTEFDETTRIAVRDLQANSDLVVDGVAGQQTAEFMGVWSPPPVPEPDASTCADEGASAVIDREYQRSWLCTDGEVSHVFGITTAWDQPDPGDYEVMEKDMYASSTETGEYSEMTHFVVFARGKYKGARVGFHSVPTYPGGAFIQPLDSVGTAEYRGQSSGCIRALPDDAQAIWDHLAVGDPVIVIS
ncbi:MAG: L,D-transpeptidase family protein [Actinomycetota bacterium]|nr:L,D-transpeptidase family protein [Actinomycetota bacterium]MDA3007785.1 L,D-transpeptidase family protein [Actinomycetota bacterium]MDA3035016.1 L,D-transpeptidase family protein [Actinomycetota bacterium]